MEAAGANHDDVLAWVEVRNGYLGLTERFISTSLRRCGEQTAGEDFYAVSRDALGV